MIAEYIASQLTDFGTLGTDLFYSSLPDTPNNVICVFDESGVVQPYQSDYGSDWVGVQILMRGTYSYVKQLWDIHNFITGINEIDTDDFYLVTSTVQNVPFQVEVDDKGRRVWSAHYMYLLSQKDNTNRIPTMEGS